MAGTLRGLGTVVTGAAGLPVSQNMFSFLVSFFDSHTGFTRIASFYGEPQWEGSPAVQVAGLGFGPSGSATAVGDGAWAVYRKTAGIDSYDLFLAYSYNVVTTTHPSGAYYLNIGNIGFGVMWAWNSGSNPWNGTTSNTGSDYFTTPWKSNAIVLPSSNEKANPASNAGGVITTGSRNSANNFLGSAAIYPQCYLMCVADDDNVNIFWDDADNIFNSGLILERYVPYSSEFDLPYVLIGRGWTNNNEAQVLPSYIQGNRAYTMGITARKNSNSGSSSLTSSYAVKVEYPKFLSRGYDTIGNQNFGIGFSSGSDGTGQVISEFPLQLGIGSPIKKYAGYTSMFRIVSHAVSSSTRYGTNGERCSIGFSIPGPPPTVPLWASASISWSSSFGLHPSGSISTRKPLFHTSSFAGIAYMPVTASNLFEDQVSRTIFDVFYRGKGQGVTYSGSVNTEPAGTTDVVILFTNYA